jgi:hypothetical protein
MKMQTPPKITVAAYFIGVLGTFLIMVVLVLFMRHYTRPAPLDQERALERKKNLMELNAASAEVLTHYAWTNLGMGLPRTVVLPIDRAMELTVQLWKNPEAGRSNLIQRLEKAKTPPPPVNYE